MVWVRLVARSVQQQWGDEPPSSQGEVGWLGLCGRGRCSVSFHGMGRCDMCWEQGGALLQQEQGLAGCRGRRGWELSPHL